MFTQEEEDYLKGLYKAHFDEVNLSRSIAELDKYRQGLYESGMKQKEINSLCEKHIEEINLLKQGCQISQDAVTELLEAQVGKLK
jgi:hypothetical protein